MTHLPSLPTGGVMYAVLAGILIASALPVVALVVIAEPVLMVAVLLSDESGSSAAMLLLVTVVSALAGDVLSYWVGRRFGARPVGARGIRRWRGKVSGATQTVRCRGILGAVVLQRWVGPGRGFVPVIIGASGQPFGRFAGSAAIAATLWGATIILAVHLGGPRLVMAVPLVLTPVLLVFAAYRIIRSLLRRRRTHAAAAPAGSTMSHVMSAEA